MYYYFITFKSDTFFRVFWIQKTLMYKLDDIKSVIVINLLRKYNLNH